ncbi:ribosome-inactivating family protein [Streptomyces sp. NBC_00111]|uniref:ribosome-inactivating family protein n=1 Tax=Streptomyces sp. NBC_00111 TaxID=2975655 RepID=UPI00324E09AA
MQHLMIHDVRPVLPRKLREARESPLRRIRRRAGALLLAFALAVGLAGLTAPAAQADPNQPLTVYGWVTDDLGNGGTDPHNGYWGMIANIHSVSGHDFYQTSVDETTSQTSRLIQINVWRYGQQQAALYFWANNLYLAGFYQPGEGHFAFNDTWPDSFDAVLGVNARRLPWNGNYATLPGGSNRSDDVINGPSLDDALQQLRTASTHLNTAAGTQRLGNALVMIIQATSEAARFGRIFNTVRNNILNRTSNQLTADAVNLEQNWGSISSWVYRVLNNPAQPPLVVGGRTFSTLQALILYVSYLEIHSGSRPR